MAKGQFIWGHRLTKLSFPIIRATLKAEIYFKRILWRREKQARGTENFFRMIPISGCPLPLIPSLAEIFDSALKLTEKLMAPQKIAEAPLYINYERLIVNSHINVHRIRLLKRVSCKNGANRAKPDVHKILSYQPDLAQP